MSNPFDKLVDKVDEIHQKNFSVDVRIDGFPTKGIFDEITDEFEGVDAVLRTLEIPISDLPLVPMKNDETKIFMVADGRTFILHKQGRVGKNVTLELR